MTTQTQQTQNNFFNLHVTGVGYLNNIRKVEPKKGNAFFSCNIAALTGDSSAPEYRYFNVNVVGEQNEKLIRKCQQAVDAGKKVLIAFTFGDLWTDTFTYQKDSQYHNKGDVGVMLKARLIRIKSITVDGDKVYQEERQEVQQQALAQKSAPQYQSEPVDDATFDSTPPQHDRASSNTTRQQTRSVAPVQYPEDSF